MHPGTRSCVTLRCARAMHRARMREVLSMPTPHKHAHMHAQAARIRRLLSRTWHGDPMLSEMFANFVATSSITQLIENSHVFKAMWRNTQAYNRIISERGLRNLRASQNRFCSHVKPLGRLVLYMEAVIQVAVDIIAQRPSQRPREIAEDFLSRICAESTLQLALMAEAGDEVSHLLRLCDKGLDTAELLAHVGDFAARIDYLFLNGGVFHTMGFAEFTIRNTLSKAICWKVRGELRSMSLSGPELDFCKQRCLRRMQAWHRLTMATLAAEFPDFDLCNAFCIFSLPDPDAADGGQAPPFLQRGCAKLAQALNVDADTLQCELLRLRLVAARHNNMKGLTNMEAWQLAMQDLMSKRGHQMDAPTGATLSTCLQRYGAYAISTCGLERKFSQQTFTGRTQSLHQCASTASLKAKLTNDYTVAEAQTIIATAQEVWMSLFKGTRATHGPRMHKGLSLPATAERLNSEAGWLRKRRASVQGAMAAGARDGGGDPSVAPRALTEEELGDAWGPTHAKEEQYQTQKRRKIQIECWHRHTLLPDECDESLPLEAAEDGKKRLDKAETQHREKQRNKHRLALQFKGCLGVTAKNVFIEPGSLTAAESQHIEQILAHKGVEFLQQRCQCDVFVSSNLATGVCRTSWAACLVGGWVVSPATLRHAQHAGAAVKYRRALDIRRRLYITPACQEVYPRIVQLLSGIIAFTEARLWRIIHAEEEYILAKAEAMAARQSPRVLAIGLEAELHPLADKVGGGDPAKKHVFVMAGALSFLQNVDVCCTGAAQLGN